MGHLQDEWKRVISSRRPKTTNVVSIDEHRAKLALREFFAMPSWRGLMEGPIWTDYPACVLVDPTGGRRQTYEVYIGGEARPRCQRLSEAKEAVEKVLGPCTWERIKPEPQWADHYYFGPTTMFTDPVTAYVAYPVV